MRTRFNVPLPLSMRGIALVSCRAERSGPRVRAAEAAQGKVQLQEEEEVAVEPEFKFKLK